jgi:hypothetical protein
MLLRCARRTLMHRRPRPGMAALSTNHVTVLPERVTISQHEELLGCCRQTQQEVARLVRFELEKQERRRGHLVFVGVSVATFVVFEAITYGLVRIRA